MAEWALICSVGALLASAAGLQLARKSALAVARSEPNALREATAAQTAAAIATQRDLERAKSDLNGRLDSMETKQVSWRTDIEGLLEAVEDTLERTERKRRSAAASASRRNAEVPEGPDPNSMEGLKQIARARGIDVM